jgi:hypothetical protein
MSLGSLLTRTSLGVLALLASGCDKGGAAPLGELHHQVETALAGDLGHGVDANLHREGGSPAADGAKHANDLGTTGGSPLFGSTHSPNNRPISDWETDILSHFGKGTIVDSLATADLQACIKSSTTWGAAYVSFGDDSYTVYYAQTGDPEYPVVDDSGSKKTCALDQGKGWTGVRFPAAAHAYGATSLNAFTPSNDTHFSIVDVQRNRIYTFYAGSGATMGLSGGQWASPYRGCDLLTAAGTDGQGDAALLSAQSASKRYACTDGTSGSCKLPGGAGVAQNGSTTFGWGDSNGYMSGHGVIMPEDFDDTGWSGAAVGTLHHALRCSNPDTCQYGGMWPVGDAGAGTAGQHVLNGQILQLDPSVNVSSLGASAYEKRVLKTLQVYGCVISDYATWGMELFALSAWDGTGPQRSSNPWTAAGGAGTEAQAAYSGANSKGTKSKFLPHLDLTKLQVILPHGGYAGESR